MFAQVSGLKPGELVHVISDAHIYDRHIPIIQEMIERIQYPSPQFRLNPDIRDFYDFKVDDLIIENYQTNPQIKNIPIAV
jgi:thymidylate synthase